MKNRIKVNLKKLPKALKFNSDTDISSKLSHNSDESLDELEKSFKSLRSTDVEDEKNPKKKQMTDVVEVEELVNLEIKKSVNCLNLNDFKKRIPNWGGQLVDFSNKLYYL